MLKDEWSRMWWKCLFVPRRSWFITVPRGCFVALLLSGLVCPDAQARVSILKGDAVGSATPNAQNAARLFPQADQPLRLARKDDSPPVWHVTNANGSVGYIASTWEISGSVGYSGRPLDILVGVSLDGRITGALLVQHNEPVLTLGLSTEDIAAYVSAFAGYDPTMPKIDAFADAKDLPPIVARATVTTGVIRDAILRTARTVALGRGLIQGSPAGVDRVSFEKKTWAALVADGSLTHKKLSLSQARQQFGPVRNPPPDGDKPFIELWIGLVDPPTIGRNLLGQQVYARAVGSLGQGDQALFVASSGLYSHRGTAYRSQGVFDRIEVIQGPRTIRLKKEDYLRVDRLAPEDAPKLKELSVFRLRSQTGFEPSEPFRIEVTAERKRQDGTVSSIPIALEYSLPSAYKLAAAKTEIAGTDQLWKSAWERKRFIIVGVILMILVVSATLFVQGPIARRPRLWQWGRTAFLLITLVWLGWIAGGQLSVVHVVFFIQSLLTGFRWETFLIEPVVFLLWSFLALGLLFWGRGVYCGWLCPFGALQELMNEGAKRLGVKQIEVPFLIQERLWAIKYALFLLILGLSFYSMEKALVLAEVEPFKTAMSMRFMRAWPFVLFVLALLVAGLFIERFYCRYLCPLGAALAIPAKLKLFDWLTRRPQCGRECRFCETQCTVGAIDPLGRINANECVLCLRCQVILSDETQCTVLKQRDARRSQGNDLAPPPAASLNTTSGDGR